MKTRRPHTMQERLTEKARHDELRAELNSVREQFSGLIHKIHGPSRLREKDALEEVRAELRKVSDRMSELYSQLPRDYENHGWVWLFLRQPREVAETTAAPSARE